MGRRKERRREGGKEGKEEGREGGREGGMRKEEGGKEKEGRKEGNKEGSRIREGGKEGGRRENLGGEIGYPCLLNFPRRQVHTRSAKNRVFQNLRPNSGNRSTRVEMKPKNRNSQLRAYVFLKDWIRIKYSKIKGSQNSKCVS
jgi:hypothetical protein